MISHRLYDHPRVRAAFDEASRIMENWALYSVDRILTESAVVLTTGWDGVALREAIACALLRREGIDEEDLESFEELDERYPDASQRALYEMWDDLRAEFVEDDAG